MLRELVELLRDSHAGIALLYDEFHEVWDGRVPRESPLATLFGAVKAVQIQGGAVTRTPAPSRWPTRLSSA